MGIIRRGFLPDRAVGRFFSGDCARPSGYGIKQAGFSTPIGLQAASPSVLRQLQG